MRAFSAALLWLAVAVLFREALEAHMVFHALGQLPALVVVGALVAKSRVFRESRLSLDGLAPAALLLALFGGAFWMLPRMLDGSLASPSVEFAKLVTLPLLVGLPLGWSWPRLGAVTRAFVWSNLVSMLLALGWLYLAAPVRACSYYLLEEQQDLGRAYVALAVGVVAVWLPRLFLAAPAQGDVRNSARRTPHPSRRWLPGGP